MSKQIFLTWACLTCLALSGRTFAAEEVKPPNLPILQTDEHNFRTLGCYRQQLSYEQAHVWGRGVRVDTPHIDSIERDGAICTSFYAASPVCTPSRIEWQSKENRHEFRRTLYRIVELPPGR
ncbi:hypothetical protein Poly41_63480 [Novipirellula artificiosorum]|uniref:Sulfatase n=1 Tax=Novipirellula artificiosorum TaxID=2528016 RepID=A0A5C6D628_9BACT|nr:hypothetical protein Poly41_63480 [Novipirellula artificiosorum]